MYLLISLTVSSCTQERSGLSSKPNILIFYVDDLGYGDLSCYGATAVKTPHVDKLAQNGLIFTDAHCSASTCTPSRYSLLTGSYAFRNNAAILPGDAPLIINQNQETIADMLKKAGYATGVVGKWHLGLGDGSPDWNSEIKPGPLEIGFDYSFLIPATPDRVPTVFVENHKVVNLDSKDPISIDYNKRIGKEPTGLEHPELLKIKADTQHSGTIVNGISRIGFMAGGHQAYWKDEKFATVLTAKAKEFIMNHKDEPFFLFFSLPNIHVPRAPDPRFAGASKLGPRGDAIAEMDWMTGEITKTLRELGIEENTLVIFSSDNGPVLDDGYSDEASELNGSYKPAGIYKGGKYSAFEGGTRVPTIASWPGVINPGKSKALLSQVDFFASFAKLAGQHDQYPATAYDSEDMSAVLLGRSNKGRNIMLEESFTMAIREGYWKYIEPVSKKTPGWLNNKDVPTGLQSVPQLYNLEDDPQEKYNLIDRFPQKAKELKDQLKLIKKNPSRNRSK